MSVDNNAPGKKPDGGEYDRAWMGMLAALTSAGYLKAEAVLELLEEAEKTDELPAMPVDTARAALNWLVMNGYSDPQTEHVATEQLLEQLRTYTVPAHVRPDISVLATLDPRFDDAMKQHEKLAMRRFKCRAALTVGGTAVVIGGIVLWTMFPFTPACDASTTKKTLFGLGIEASVRASEPARSDICAEAAGPTRDLVARRNGSRLRRGNRHPGLHSESPGGPQGRG
jgi:hypothetical protein